MDDDTLIKAGIHLVFHVEPLGKLPSAVDQEVMALVHRIQFLHPIVMRRANEYYKAGCPVDLVETAACRDIFSLAQNLKPKNQIPHEDKNHVSGGNPGDQTLQKRPVRRLGRRPCP